MWAVAIGPFVAAVLIILIIQCLRRWMRPTYQGVLPPGSMGLPLIGETLELFFAGTSLDVLPFLKKRILKYGPIFRTSLLGRPIVVSADPKVNHFMLSQEGKLVEFWLLDSFAKVFAKDGIASGAVHKYIRNASLNLLGVAAIQKNLLPQLEEMVCKTLDSWSEQDQLVELKQGFAKMLFDFAAKILFSYESENSSEDLGKMISNMSKVFMSLPINIPGTAFHECMKAKKVVINIIKRKLKEKLAAASTRCQEQEDFLDQAIREMATKDFLQQDFIVELTFILLFAILESNSSSLAFTFWIISQHPTTIKELQAEQEAMMKGRKDLNSSLTWNEYKSLTFTRQVVNETLRLANLSPGFFRRALKDFEVNGYTIPAGWTIWIASSAQHLNSNVFDDPLKFNPRRWEDLDLNTVNENFVPFGEGVRQCAGAEFSKAIMSTFLHVLVTKYRWDIVKTGDFKRTPLLTFGDGIYVKVLKKE